MTDTSFHLKVVTPNEVFFEGPTVSVVAPGFLGYFGVLKDHAPFVTAAGEGNLTFRSPSGETKSFKMQGGFIEVSNNRVLVLTDKIT